VTPLFQEQPTLRQALVTPVPEPIVAPLAAPGLMDDAAFGLDLILEGFLLHHGTPRLLSLPVEDRILAGDFCYAQGLVRVASAGDLRIIRELADLIALSASLVANDQRTYLSELWRTVVAAIADDAADRRDSLDAAKGALRLTSDVGPLRSAAASAPSAPALDEVFDA